MKTSRLISLFRPGLLAAAFAVCASIQAQDAPTSTQPKPAANTDSVRAYIEMLRSDFNTSKIATINQVMQLTGAEAGVFWPIYRNYEKELAAVGDRKLEMIREFAALNASGTLDSKKADDLAKRWLKNTQDRLDLWKKYQKQISKAVSPIRAAQFLQIENQMALFVDVNIASEMPVVKAGPAAAGK
jgi:hypothetical protein